MTKDELVALIAKGEGQTVEFKETTGASKAATKTLAAFASQPQGGVVVFGVNDDGTSNNKFTVAATTSAQLAGSIRANTVSITTAQPLLPVIHTFKAPDLLAVEVLADAVRGGPYLAFGVRWQRVGASTHEVKMDYRQLARAYRQHLVDDEETAGNPFGLRFCPQCGNEKLQGRSVVDYDHDELFLIVECSCGWVDWSQ
ncbi:ATP-binding protein [Rhodococcus sp. D-46]|uniref:RNA-binding domain-containing protein n=1 Tax=Rhodococcus sp. D-46 TaxID=2716265 RepID=UPI0013F63453|nr:ATP-binding protein [Rhodococcus sp. D-46]